tara:strand:+ start:285 stop:1073 length:789 start_codon:yes stop_codon:yes gene_type:complete
MYLIYGDSYCDYNEIMSWDFDNGDLCWQNQLKKHEDIKVYSSGGRSTYESLRILQEKLPRQGYLRGDKVIFLLTDRTRIPFPFLDKPTHTGAADDMYRAYKSNKDIDLFCAAEDPAEGYEIGGSVYNNMEKVIGVYDTFKPEIKMWAFYTCLFLKHLNMKTLVLTTEKNVFKDVPYDWSTLNDLNFKIVDTQLREVCGNEFHDGIIRSEIESKRKNHLSYPNHIVLYNIISNFFYGTKLSEEFHEDLYHIKDGEEISEFIYE